MHVLLWGTYDIGKPRMRIIRRALDEAGVLVTEIHADVWDGVEDKSRETSASAIAHRCLRWAGAYPRLLWRYLRAPRHDVVLVGYLGLFDVIALWPLTLIRRRPIVWDAFLSLYDTVVRDRRLVGPRSPAAVLLRAVEAVASRIARVIVLDTNAHAALFARIHGVRSEKLRSVFVGAEPVSFSPAAETNRQARTNSVEILFYGQFIPLHGVETIVRAAQLTVDKPFRWRLIGRGQEAARMRKLIAQGPPAKIDWDEWVPYEELADAIAQADVCLGVFGVSDKAASVIPNKAFQILSVGRPIITRDGPGIRELLEPDATGVRLIPPGDPAALAHAVCDLAAVLPDLSAPLHKRARQRFAISELGGAWRAILEEARS